MLWTKLEANTIMLDRICRASRGGATRPSCRANDQRRLEWPTFLFWWRGKSMLSRHSQRHDKASLSRQAWWRDRAAVPRQRPTQTRKACISLTLARGHRLVVPPGMARQALFPGNCMLQLLLLGHYSLLYETADVKNHVSLLE